MNNVNINKKSNVKKVTVDELLNSNMTIDSIKS